eukprot:8825659-Pyramimonas_sp.AAC.1
MRNAMGATQAETNGHETAMQICAQMMRAHLLFSHYLAPRLKHHKLVTRTCNSHLPVRSERCPSFMAGLKTPTPCGGLVAHGPE